MLVPRIIINLKPRNKHCLEDIELEEGIGLFLNTGHLSDVLAKQFAQKAKLICLDRGAVLLLDNLEIAILTNADGVCCPVDDVMHGRAKDIFGENKLVGGTAHSIEGVADFYEEGMVDFVILESFAEHEEEVNILGKRKTQSIIDDARIMGYDLPILLSGGIDKANLAEALSIGAYGLIVPESANDASLKDVWKRRPFS